MLIVDVRNDLSKNSLNLIRSMGVVVVVIDDASDRRLAADLAFYPPVPQIETLDWSDFSGQLFVGWDWIILRPQFTWSSRAIRSISSQKPAESDSAFTLLITMGGSDPDFLTLMAIDAIERIELNVRVVLVVGGGFVHWAKLNERLSSATKSYDIRTDVADMASVMAEADLAVASFGVTAYELAAMGVPAIYLCLTEDHAISAEIFSDMGIAKSLGSHEINSSESVANAIIKLLSDVRLLNHMSSVGMRSVDGNGSKRIAERCVHYAKLNY